MKTGRIDSAKYWFRKELQNATDYNNKNAGAWGLANAFNLSHQNDSASKYYKYAYEMNDSAYAEMAINEVERMQAMYNYSRHQKIALEEKELSSRLKNRLTFIISLSVIIGLVSYLILYIINRKRKDAVRNYANSLKQIEQAHFDLIRLQDLDKNRRVLIDEKDAQIDQLQVEIKTYQNHKNESNHNKIEKDIKESVEYKRFSELSRKGLIPSDKEWQELRVMAFSYLPDFYQLLISKRHLINLKEYNACVLIRLHYKPSDLCNMLEISSGHANKIRKQLLQKLFGIEGKADLFDSKIITYY